MQLSTRAAAREAASRDVLAADLRCSLFVSALQSYKRDSVLRPFPASYARHDYKDFEALFQEIQDSLLASASTRNAHGLRHTSRVSLCSCGCPGTHSGLQLTEICLPLLPKCWD